MARIDYAIVSFPSTIKHVYRSGTDAQAITHSRPYYVVLHDIPATLVPNTFELRPRPYMSPPVSAPSRRT